jgi:hypothetical protein
VLVPSALLPVTLAAFALWACSAAIRLWMNACIASDGSVLEVVVDESEEVELVDVPDVAPALVPALEVPPVTPICDSASRMELINPPDGGGGGAGGGASKLTSEVPVASD